MKSQNHHHGIGKKENSNEPERRNKEEQSSNKPENRNRKEEDERVSKDRERVKNQQTPREVWELSDRVLGNNNSEDIENGYRSPFTPL